MTTRVTVAIRAVLAAVLVVPIVSSGIAAQAPATSPPPPGPIQRMPDGTPDLNGFFQSDGGGANYGLAPHARVELTPPGRGVIIDPPDGLLPIQPWAKAEQESRLLPERGYDDPTAHCFLAGVPRSFYVPAPFHILPDVGHGGLPARAHGVAHGRARPSHAPAGQPPLVAG